MINIDDCLCSRDGGDHISHTPAPHKEENVLEVIEEILHENMRREEQPHRKLSSSFRCPEHSSATKHGPASFADCVCHETYHRDEKSSSCVNTFQCEARYAIREGLAVAKSFADCVCKAPYTKDDSTGDCNLTFCPRSGHYIKKHNVERVMSLADCTCEAPFVKNEQSGECFSGYECPEHSTSPHRQPNNFKDCTCAYGYVKRDNECQHEQPAYKCPPHSTPLTKIPHGFEDCECKDPFVSNLEQQLCQQPHHKGRHVDQFTCPSFSVPLALMPYGMRQCMCLPGFSPNFDLGECDWNPTAYKCPPHSYNPHPDMYELEFSDCKCAKGYVRNEMGLSCEKPKPKPVVKVANATTTTVSYDPNHCPSGSYVTNWPVKSKAQCTCINSDCKPLAPHPTLLLQNGFYYCPANMMLLRWPVKSLSDCICKNGFNHTTSGVCELNRADFCPKGARRTVDGNSCACTNGFELNSQDNTCKYPYEDVLRHDDVDKEQLIVLNGNEMEFRLVDDGIMVTQGDIAVGVSYGEIMENVHVFKLHGYYNHERDHRWKDGRMCFRFDERVKSREKEIRHVLHHISTVTGFEFMHCRNDSCKSHCQDHVVFQPTATGCYSYIGRIGLEQAIGISSDCIQGNLMHVMLHAMGLHHPIVRLDRSEHIDINWDCIPDRLKSYFAIEDLNAPNIPYDFYSIMHHPHQAFATDKSHCLTILPRIANATQRLKVAQGMGQRDQLSLTDIHYVWSLYPELKTPDRQYAMKKQQHHHHVSHIHTKAEMKPKSTPATDYVAPMVFVLAFLCFMLFVAYEIRLRQFRGKDCETDLMYSDPLLHDAVYCD